MTSSNHEKMLNQIGHKPGKLAKYNKYNVPKKRKYGKNVKTCRFTGSRRGVIHKYGLDVDRRKFREIANEIGFKKYS